MGLGEGEMGQCWGGMEGFAKVGVKGLRLQVEGRFPGSLRGP